MTAYSRIQQNEFAREKMDIPVLNINEKLVLLILMQFPIQLSSGKSSTTAMEGSTESEQF